MKREVILHCFQWRLVDILIHLDEIAEQGFTAIQISPMQGAKDEGYEFWKLYQPTHMSLVGNPHIGCKDDLVLLCTQAKKRNIKIIVDVVLRHTAGTDDGKLVPHESVDKLLTRHKSFWTGAENTTDYKDRWSMTNLAFGMPMLNYNNLGLQCIYIDFLLDLKNCGVGGFRIDMGKHFSLREEGSHFWRNVFGGFSDLFNYAECLECDTELLDKYVTCLQGDKPDGKYMNVISDYNSPTDKTKMVCYIMSHDTEETWGFTKKLDDATIINEWRHLLEYNRESSALFYPRQYSDLWRDPQIRSINTELNK